jgi:hypothetical protein
MKRNQIRQVVALATFFSILFGASAKVWGYSYGKTFLIIGLILFIITIALMVPKDDGFLDH